MTATEWPRAFGGVCRHCGGPATVYGCRSGWRGCPGKRAGSYGLEPVGRLCWLLVRPPHRSAPLRIGPLGLASVRTRVRTLRACGYSSQARRMIELDP